MKSFARTVTAVTVALASTAITFTSPAVLRGRATTARYQRRWRGVGYCRGRTKAHGSTAREARTPDPARWHPRHDHQRNERHPGHKLPNNTAFPTGTSQRYSYCIRNDFICDTSAAAIGDAIANSSGVHARYFMDPHRGDSRATATFASWFH